ncbi:hypothetical protein EYF80_020609 [Liparis tanakae]|uniref:Uncharacterized protein n=1 Tax=Liparis tanakae TaxID=230148 RepID=A0A4Z2HW71_9TELE|nr:hypothetical protein EYF80_020609 [Liparis tanakae]
MPPVREVMGDKAPDAPSAPGGSAPVGGHCLFLRPRGDNVAGCEESAAGHQMGAGCTVCSPLGKGEGVHEDIRQMKSASRNSVMADICFSFEMDAEENLENVLLAMRRTASMAWSFAGAKSPTVAVSRSSGRIFMFRQVLVLVLPSLLSSPKQAQSDLGL